ncbi:hypothetical protein N7451_003111 [Penicillium sp. IBT 35674x]|nr:hypothetical protein N7451_003111 [Penicillium sp. IBT 35674x]
MTATYPDLQGKAVVVTGASSGIERELAIQLAQQGANVGLLDIVKPDEVADEIQKLTNQARAISLAVDVTKADQVDAAIQQVLSTFGRLDGAANVAGIVGDRQVSNTSHGLETLKDADWDKIIRANLDGVKNCLRAEFRAMKDPVAILNAGSISGQMANPFATAYSVSKWGLIGLTKGAAGEVGSRGIRLNCVAPY